MVHDNLQNIFLLSEMSMINKKYILRTQAGYFLIKYKSILCCSIFYLYFFSLSGSVQYVGIFLALDNNKI